MRELVTLIVFQLAVFGLATAIAVLKIGRYFLGVGYCLKEGCTAPGHPKELRKGLGKIPYFGDLLYCPPCLAFWIGMAASWWFVSPAAAVGLDVKWKATLVDGLAACAVSWILHVAVMWKAKDVREI